MATINVNSEVDDAYYRYKMPKLEIKVCFPSPYDHFVLLPALFSLLLNFGRHLVHLHSTSL